MLRFRLITINNNSIIPIDVRIVTVCDDYTARLRNGKMGRMIAVLRDDAGPRLRSACRE